MAEFFTDEFDNSDRSSWILARRNSLFIQSNRGQMRPGLITGRLADADMMRSLLRFDFVTQVPAEMVRDQGREAVQSEIDMMGEEMLREAQVDIVERREPRWEPTRVLDDGYVVCDDAEALFYVVYVTWIVQRKL